ncbi:MAG: tetratricopeptide repeat protein [Acidobacteria bacterium]|nr:tetratricopeptide repeat protein [Acidobacteriota bacterium]
MTVTALRMALVAGFVACAVSPASAQRRELQQMAADIRILQEQTQLLQNALVGLTDALKAVNQRIDEQTGVTRKTFADAKLQSETMGSDIRVVRERVDDTNVRITSLSQEVESLRDAIAAMPVPTQTTDAALPGAPGLPGDPAAPATGATPPPAAGGTPSTVTPPPAPAAGPSAMSPSRLYDLAWADYTAGNYDLAVEGFSSYVRSFPKSEFADNAQYYIGESYYQRGKLAEAVDAFGRLISTYPRSDVAGQAYYKRGLVYERMNQPDRAREAYDYLVKTLGDTDAGRLAKQRLDALNRARPQ